MNRRPRNSRYWLEKRSNKRTGFPMASLAYYGPDNRRASKAVVGIFRSDGPRQPDELRKWFSDTSDVRYDAEIIEEIVDYLEELGVQRVATLGRLIGCPHEEVIDYPEGEVCPQCPYWANRNRWTGRVWDELGALDDAIEMDAP